MYWTKISGEVWTRRRSIKGSVCSININSTAFIVSYQYDNILKNVIFNPKKTPQEKEVMKPGRQTGNTVDAQPDERLNSDGVDRHC
jgi:hypothetical protein